MLPGQPSNLTSESSKRRKDFFTVSSSYRHHGVRSCSPELLGALEYISGGKLSVRRFQELDRLVGVLPRQHFACSPPAKVIFTLNQR